MCPEAIFFEHKNTKTHLSRKKVHTFSCFDVQGHLGVACTSKKNCGAALAPTMGCGVSTPKPRGGVAVAFPVARMRPRLREREHQIASACAAVVDAVVGAKGRVAPASAPAEVHVLPGRGRRRRHRARRGGGVFPRGQRRRRRRNDEEDLALLEEDVSHHLGTSRGMILLHGCWPSSADGASGFKYSLLWRRLLHRSGSKILWFPYSGP